MTKITIGKDSSLEEGAKTEISLGERCVVESGIHIKPDSIVVTKQKLAGFKPGAVLKASELSGFPNLVFKKGTNPNEIEVVNNYGG